MDKILLENPKDPLANLLQGIHIFFNIAESNQKHGLKEFLIYLGVEPSIRSFTLADSSIAGNFSFELNRDFNSSLLANHMEEGIIPALVESESHFARIPLEQRDYSETRIHRYGGNHLGRLCRCPRSQIDGKNPFCNGQHAIRV